MALTRVFPVLLLVTLSWSAACASSTGSTRRNSNILTQDEIAAAKVSDLFEAVERLRPRWLDVRAPRSINSPTRILVFMNRTHVGGPEALRQFDARNVVQLKYLDAAQAAATLTYPSGAHVEGAIVVELTAGAR